MAAESSPCLSGWSDIAKIDAVAKQEQMPQKISASFKSSKGIMVAVVDASAVIDGGEKLWRCAEKLVSVKEVLDEIRDPASRHKLVLMPCNIQSMEPTEEALKKVINFSRATGDLQFLSHVDLKLLALTYTLEAQVHGIAHLRTQPPPLHVKRVRKLHVEKLPGWGSNVPNLDEWEALERSTENIPNSSEVHIESRILGLKTLLNLSEGNPTVCSEGGHVETKDGHTKSGIAGQAQLKVEKKIVPFEQKKVPRKQRRYKPERREVKLDGRLMVADGIDASKGESAESTEDWQLAVCRSTRRRYLRRHARKALSQSSAKSDQNDTENNQDQEVRPSEVQGELSELESDQTCREERTCNVTEHEEASEENPLREEESDTHENLCHGNATDCINGVANINILGEEIHERREDVAEHETSDTIHADGGCNFFLGKGRFREENSMLEVGDLEYKEDEDCRDSLDHMENTSLTDGSVATTVLDDSTSEQSWILRPFSESTVACATRDFAMQNVLLQMGLRLLSPNGVRVRQLHRWALKCHACNGVTAEVGRLFCPKCGNGGTLRKISMTVGENGTVQAVRRQPRISIRGTKYSLPLPQGGREAITKNPILREDQLAHKMLYPKTKKSSCNLGMDLLNFEEIGFQTKEKRAPLQAPVREAVAVFSGKRNPNDNRFSRHKH
eukprot:Gb_33378 [translate_table: standard]